MLAKGLVLLALLPLVWGHAQMTVPRPASPVTCPELGGDICPGPCDPDFPPTEVTATFRRGQATRVRYQRNNHGPGGFMRITMVQPENISNFTAHDRNAFHYSCWGARVIVATAADETPVEGVSLVGTEADTDTAAYYFGRVRIPTVIPDGEYIFGWTWYGGIGDSEIQNTFRPRIPPGTDGRFQDYWTCSRVRIQGGPMTSTYNPMFVNDMRQFSRAGCMSGADRLGVCTSEPCNAVGSFRRPAEFVDRTPDPLTPSQFGGDDNVDDITMNERLSACRCLASSNCANRHAVGSGNRCTAGQPTENQSEDCVQACCPFCAEVPRPRICNSGRVRGVCPL